MGCFPVPPILSVICFWVGTGKWGEMGAPSPAPHHLSAPGTGIPTMGPTELSAWLGRWSWLWEATLGGSATHYCSVPSGPGSGVGADGLMLP